MSIFQNSNQQSCFRSINDEGASLIQVGCYAEAITLLSAGLRNLRQHMLSLKTSMSTPASIRNHGKTDGRVTSICCVYCQQVEDDGQSSSCMAPTFPSTPSNLSSRDATSTSCVELDQSVVFGAHSAISRDGISDSEDLFLYSTPLCHGQQRHCHQTPLETMAFSMMFNLALSYDLQAETSSGADQEMGKKTALRLYELAYEMQSSETEEVNVSLLYCCGMVNNMGRIYYRSQEQKNIEWCGLTLMQLLMYYKTRARQFGGHMENNQESPRRMSVEEFYFGEFFRSASTLLLPGSNTAAAA